MTSMIGGLVILVFILLLVYHYRTVRITDAERNREIVSLSRVEELVDSAIEEGQRIHVSLGYAKLGQSQSAGTLAALDAFRAIAKRSCDRGVAPLVTVADPVLVPMVQDIIRESLTHAGYSTAYRPTQVEFVAPNPTQYAIGASQRIDPESIYATVVIGTMDERLLFLVQPSMSPNNLVSGSDHPVGMASSYAATSNSLIGEEIFAASAYLHPDRLSLAGLKTQDAVRIGIALLIIVFVILNMIGVTTY